MAAKLRTVLDGYSTLILGVFQDFFVEMEVAQRRRRAKYQFRFSEPLGITVI